MKFKKFEYKFVDHDKKTFNIVCINIYSNKNKDIAYNEENIEQKIQIEAEHAKYAHIFKDELKRIVKNRLFTEFDRYELEKVSCKKESAKANIGTQQGNPVFKEYKHMEIHKHKLSRGPKPINKRDMFNYTKFYNVYNYYVSTDSQNQFQFQELPSFSLPQEKHSNINNSNLKVPANQTATGGKDWNNSNSWNNWNAQKGSNNNTMNNNYMNHMNNNNNNNNNNSWNNSQKGGINNNNWYDNNNDGVRDYYGNPNYNNNQNGGADYNNNKKDKELYKKYKDKYIKLKNQLKNKNISM
ncbi:hypothetical protein QLL95_gp1247 [Cotonvirus japonicus]|uniref:Uncharacterized protein n=1 Tax=Cotonvirus japonicus TaxID=2811091 RepID=A0ABM7NRZ4_9VIRU|nr:hypothetical protein QLL95_gp1247 [Cotonvirus japonicus]BCS82876.1 hypothetical protein [Cotonvirus japonicus]